MIMVHLSIVTMSMFAVMPSNGMEERLKHALDLASSEYASCVGTQDATTEHQERANDVFETFQQKQLLKPGTQIALKYFSPGFREQLENSGVTVWNNSVTNGYNTIHVGEEISELNEGQFKSKIAHEAAHIVIRQTQNNHLNPHWYMKNLHDGLIWNLGLSPFWISAACSYPIMRYDRIPRWLTCTILANLVGSPIALHQLGKYIIERYDLPPYSPATTAARLEFTFLHKTEEVLCDVIAAMTLKNGGHDGKSLYSVHLARSGDSSGIDGDHPSLSTRVWYHGLVEKYQNYTTNKAGEKGIDEEKKEQSLE